MSKTYFIALADDDPDDQYLFAEALKLIVAKSSLSAFASSTRLLEELCKSGAKPDVIVLDMNMPGYDGITTLQKIREQEPLKAIPVYILTTSASDEDKLKAIQVGASGFYSKPDTVRGLGELVQSMLDSL